MLNIKVSSLSKRNVDVGDYLMTPYNTLYRIISITIENKSYYTLIVVSSGKALLENYSTLDRLLEVQLGEKDRIIKSEDLKLVNM